MKNKLEEQLLEARKISLIGQKRYSEQKRRENIDNNFKTRDVSKPIKKHIGSA